MNCKELKKYHAKTISVTTNKNNTFTGLAIVDIEAKTVDIGALSLNFDEIASIEIIEDKDAIDEA